MLAYVTSILNLEIPDDEKAGEMDTKEIYVETTNQEITKP